MELEERLNKDAIPKHVAIIMDGNGRWAKSRGKVRVFGHQHAVESVRDTLKTGSKIGVKYLTLYAFSTENWKRPQQEVNALMDLLVNTINQEIPTLMEHDIRLKAVGNLESLPESTKTTLRHGIEETKNNKGLNLVLALSYSARWEIVEAVKKIAKEVQDGKVEIDDITQDSFSSYLATANIPDPELMIRTSGEMRISNFLLWQLAYAELFFLPKLWPDFRGEDLISAIIDYQSRERRFGMTSEQIKVSS